MNQLGGSDLVFETPDQPPGDNCPVLAQPGLSDKSKSAVPSSTIGNGHADDRTTKPGGTDDAQETLIPTSGLTMCQKAKVPLAMVGFWTIYGSLLAQPVVWISVFGTNPTIIGVINVVMTFYDIGMVPFFGQTSDEGRFNVLCFKDVIAWGRRSPLALMSLPACCLAFWFNWVGPENFYGEQGILGVWFFMVRFAISTAFGGMLMTANTAAFSEIFPNVKERVNMASAKGLATGLGVVIGAGVLTTAAISVEDDSGSPKQKQLYLVIAIVLMFCIALALPWCLLMSRTVMTETCVRESMNKISKYVWASGNSVRFLSLSLNLFTAAANMVIPFVTFFLRQCFAFNVKQAATGQVLTVLVYTFWVVAGFPLAAYFNHRYHPTTCIAVATLVTDVISTTGGLVALYIKDDVNLCMFVLAFSLGLKGLPAATVGLSRQVLTCWVIDEDLVSQYELRQQQGCPSTNPPDSMGAVDPKELPARRDGAFSAFIQAAVNLGRLSAGICQISMGLFGYEAERDADDIPQPTAVKNFLLVLFVVVHPLCSTASWVVLYWFPIRGNKLTDLNRKYAALFNMKKDADAKQ